MPRPLFPGQVAAELGARLLNQIRGPHRVDALLVEPLFLGAVEDTGGGAQPSAVRGEFEGHCLFSGTQSANLPPGSHLVELNGAVGRCGC